MDWRSELLAADSNGGIPAAFGIINDDAVHLGGADHLLICCEGAGTGGGGCGGGVGGATAAADSAGSIGFVGRNN